MKRKEGKSNILERENDVAIKRDLRQIYKKVEEEEVNRERQQESRGGRSE